WRGRTCRLRSAARRCAAGAGHRPAADHPAQWLRLRGGLHASRTRRGPRMRQLPLAMRLRERAVFDSFVAGSNAAVLAQLQAAADAAPSRVYWLYGPPGSGKSHLLQACCTRALESGRTAAYLPLCELQEFGPDALQGWS